MVPLRPVASLINVALAASVSYSGAALSMQVLERRLEAGMPPAAAAAPMAQAQAEQQKVALGEFQAVLNANIFGARRSEVKSSAPVAPADGSAPAAAPSRAPLVVTLTGTMIMGDRAFAMIADATGRNEKVYRPLDCVPAGADHPTRTCSPTQGKLVAIHKKRIVVKYQDEQLIFDLAERPAAVASSAPPGVRPAMRPGSQGPAAPPQATQGGPAAPFPSSQEGSVLQVRVPQAEVAKSFENFSDVLKQARVVPYTDETGSGFQIRNILPGSIFERIGLTNFDKIKAVNGEPITTADQALRLLTMFRNEREITLDLERRDQQLQLNYLIE